MTKNKKAGEVAAVSGYHFQYQIFATELYNSLLNFDVEWVEFASSEVGKLDDVLIGLSDRILAFQIKEIASSTFSYNQFTNSDTESILQGAYKGWINLQTNYPGVKIDARFITVQTASKNDSIASADANAKPSFQQFVKNCWRPLHDEIYTLTSLPKSWKPVISELAGFVGATPDKFVEFVKNFSFAFEYEPNPDLHDSYTQAKREFDIDRITKQIFKLVARKGNVKFSKAQLISEFGLTKQLETHFKHSFFIDEKHYQPINKTISELDELISRKESGYFALVGNAGSGKSTLLTKWLEEQECKVLKYYAYTNADMSYDFGFRGEAELFLHDLLVQIRENKASLQDHLPAEDLLNLQRHFHSELSKLSRAGEKVFIIIDGLDHIEREQNVTKSLIEVLPHPNSIPKGVYLILGSRTISQLENLSFDVSDSLTSSSSIITISPLAKHEIQKLTDTYGVTLSQNDFDLLCSNTRGHPLFLRYTLEELLANEPTNYKSIIQANVFSGDIYQEYHKFWNRYKNKDHFVHLLGLISRFRFAYFDIQLLRLFQIKNEDVERIHKLAEFYFYKSDNIWQFFHNSFKEFLIERSGIDPLLGRSDTTLDRNFHLEIATAISESDNEYRFNQLFHLFKAEKHDQVKKVATQEFFRSQWFLFRDSEIILEDIKLAAISACQLGDTTALTVAFLATYELLQRRINFPVEKHAEVFLRIGRPDIANSLVLNNARLLVERSAALEYAVLLFYAGQKILSKEVFERAIPTKLLSGAQSLNTRRYSRSTYSEVDEVDEVAKWAVAASLFSPVTEVVKKLKKLKVENEEYSGRKKDPFYEGLSEIAESAINHRNWDKLVEIADVFDKTVGKKKAETFEFYFDLVNEVDPMHPLYSRCINFFKGWQLNNNNRVNIRYLLIFTLFEKDIDRCSPVLKKVKKPSDFKQELASNNYSGFGNYVFNYSRVFYIITKDFTIAPSSFLPKVDKLAMSGFYLAFAELGRAQAYLFHNYQEASEGFFISVERVLSIFHHHFLDPLYDHTISNEKATLVISILKVSFRLSEEIFLRVLDKISSEWRNFRRFWTTSDIQQVISWIIETKRAESWCIEELDNLQPGLFSNGYIEERIENALEQVELWSLFGNQRRADDLVTEIMNHSLDVRGEDDYQLDNLVSWISKVAGSDSSEYQFYFDRLLSVLDIVNSKGNTPAGELLRQCLPLGNGYEVFKFLLFEGLNDFTDSLESVLVHLFKTEGCRLLSIKLFSRIVLGMDDSHGTRNEFIENLFSCHPTVEEVAELVREIKIYSVLETRNNYLIAIQERCAANRIDLRKVDLDGKIQRKREHHSSDNILKLKTGESFTEDELLKKIKSLQDIIDLETKTEEHSYFTWVNLIKKIVAESDEVSMEHYLISKRLEARHYAEIAEVLIDAGKATLARKVIEAALANSRASGWVAVYDGGSKIEPYKQLQRIENRETFQQKAFKDFAQSLTELDVRSLQSLLKDLDVIFNMLTDATNYEEVYEEIKKYRNELCKNYVILADRIPVRGHLSDRDLGVDLLYFLLTFPTDFSQLIVPVLIQERTRLGDIVDRTLEKLYRNEFYWKYVQLIAGIAIYDRDLVLRNSKELKSLISHQRFDVSRLAETLLDEQDLLGDWERESTNTSLPLVYTIELTPESAILDSRKKPIDRVDEDGFLRKTENATIYTQVVAEEIVYLSQITGLNRYNLAYRVMTQGTDSQFPDWCVMLSEEELRGWYDGRLHLKIAYKRPQVQKVLDGFNKVVAELVRFGRLEEETAEILVGIFDPSIYSLKESTRPSCVPQILSERGAAPSTDANWPKSFDRDYLTEVLAVDCGGDYILAQFSLIIGQGHGRTQEIRQSFIDLYKDFDPRDEIIFPLAAENCTIEEYDEQIEPGLVLYNGRLTVNRKEAWLAINPQLAQEMGLTLNSQEGNFRWDDENGDRVVESIYWQDGDANNQNSHHNSEAAEGWMVIISKEGMKMLQSLIPEHEFYIHRKVERYMRFIQRRYGTDINERGMKFRSDKLKNASE